LCGIVTIYNAINKLFELGAPGQLINNTTWHDVLPMNGSRLTTDYHLPVATKPNNYITLSILPLPYKNNPWKLLFGFYDVILICNIIYIIKLNWSILLFIICFTWTCKYTRDNRYEPSHGPRSFNKRITRTHPPGISFITNRGTIGGLHFGRGWVGRKQLIREIHLIDNILWGRPAAALQGTDA
jgi:hypothetical protein